jgi:GT2 family glycosyltransferase
MSTTSRIRSSSSPTASVILCVRNGETTVADQVAALSTQDYPGPWELVIVDNGSTDASVSVARASWTHPSADLRVVTAMDRAGLAYARNVGVQAATGSVVVFCDADDVADPGWLGALMQAMRSADLAGGHLDVDQLNPTYAASWRGGSPTQEGLRPVHGNLPHAVGANMAVRRDRFLAVGGCDEQFSICSDDVDLCWRLQEAGDVLVYAPDAVMHYRLRARLRDAMRQQWQYGRAEGALKQKHGERMPRDSAATVRAVWSTLLLRPDWLLRGRTLRGRWLCVAAYRLGRLAGAYRFRVKWW